jgi:drug/metabolite transporter (DMT)-like permease
MSAPLAKLLLPRVDAWVLAGLLYVGAGAGLALVRVVQTTGGARRVARRSRLQREDLPTLLVIAIIGGGVGPVLMMVGLRALSGVTGALLLNLEAVFTMLLAVTVFGERLSAREAMAAVVVLVGAVARQPAGEVQFEANSTARSRSRWRVWRGRSTTT